MLYSKPTFVNMRDIIEVKNSILDLNNLDTVSLYFFCSKTPPKNVTVKKGIKIGINELIISI